MLLSVPLSVQNIENQAWFLPLLENPCSEVAAWSHLGTNGTSTTWIKFGYDAAWKTRVTHILSCSVFVDRKRCCQPSSVNSTDRTSSVALHVWPDSCTLRCKGSNTCCSLCCCDVFKIKSLRNSEPRTRLLSFALLPCLPSTFPCFCPSCRDEIA
jgi:hypothetical protein